MSKEPRIRLIKNGTVVGSVWEDDNGDLVLEEEESGETLRVGSVGVAVDALDADTLRANNSSNVTLGSALDADTNDIQNVGALDSDSVTTDELSNTHYASSYGGADGGTQIQNAIYAANAKDGPNVVVIDGAGPDNPTSASRSDVWSLSEAVTIPDDTTLVFIDCYVFLKDGSDDNILRNSAATDTGRNSNIAVEGIGEVVLDGNASNQTRVAPSDFEANIGLRFFKVDGLTIEGVTTKNPNAWGTKVEDVSDVTVDIKCDHNDATPNQDGCDVAGPANDVDVDINGVTGDDMVGIFPGGDQLDAVEGTGGDVEDLTVRAKGGSGGHHLARILAEGGNKARNIHFELLEYTGTSATSVLHFGPGTFNGSTAPSQSDFENITVSDVITPPNFDGDVVLIEGTPLANLHIDRIVAELDGNNIAAVNMDDAGNGYNAELTVGEIFVRGGGKGNYAIQNESGTLEVDVSNIKMDNVGVVVNFFDDTTVDIQNVHGDSSGTVLSTGGGTVSGHINGISGDFASGVTNTPSDISSDSIQINADIPFDVRDIPNVQGSDGYHDGSGSNTEGPAFNDGAGWESLVDGTTIS